MDFNKEDIGKLKVGRYIVVDGAACQIISMQKSAPGKHGHAKYRIDTADLITGSKKNIILTGHSKVGVPIIEKNPAQVLAISDNTTSVMDMKTYETFDLEIPDELKDSIKVGSEIIYWDILGKKILKETKK